MNWRQIQADNRRRDSVKLYRSGHTITQIAAHLGVSKQAVSKYLYEMGERTRNPKERCPVSYNETLFGQRTPEVAYFAGAIFARGGFKILLNRRTMEEMSRRLTIRRSRNDRGEFETLREFLAAEEGEAPGLISLRWQGQVQKDLTAWGIAEDVRSDGKPPEWLGELGLEEFFWRGWFEFSVPSFRIIARARVASLVGALPMVEAFIGYVERNTTVWLPRGPFVGIRRASLRITGKKLVAVGNLLYKTEEAPRLTEVEKLCKTPANERKRRTPKPKPPAKDNT